jgi:hypothetical protein
MLIGWCLVLAAISYALQTDRQRWLRGLVDIRGHFEHLSAGLEILRRNKRPMWVLLAASVLSWTGWSLAAWQDSSSKDQLEATLASFDNSAARFAASHALATAVVPLRSLTGLGDLLPLLLVACFLLFARTAQFAQDLRARVRALESVQLKRRLGTIWIGLIVLISYRMIVFIVSRDVSPMADCMYINAIVYPALLLAADAVLLSWVLAEFGRALNDHFDWEPNDTVAFVRAIPASALACALINPGRYLLVTCAVWQAQFSPTSWPAARWNPILWTVTISQVLGLTWFALPGVLVVIRRGKVLYKFSAFLSLVRRAGGQIVGLTILSVVLTFLGLLPFYWMFGAMQSETWSLLGAASYGYYVTLLLGIVLLAGVAQLAYQELGLEEVEAPKAVLIATDPVAESHVLPQSIPGQGA